MLNSENQIDYLDHLRKKARLSYFYFGFGLLLVLVVWILCDSVYGMSSAAVILLLYLCCQRKDIIQYQTEYRGTVTLNSIGRYINAKSFVQKNIVTLNQVLQDGCVPIEDTRGIVRAGIAGTYHGGEVCLSDISYTYQIRGRDGRRQAIPISGCYLRIELYKETSLPVVFCSSDLLSEKQLEHYYEKQGFFRAVCPKEDLEKYGFCYYPSEAKMRVQENVYRALLEMNQHTAGRIVVKSEHRYLYGFVRYRYLGILEPNYKYPITEESLHGDIFPELKDFLNLVDILEQL